MARVDKILDSPPLEVDVDPFLVWFSHLSEEAAQASIADCKDFVQKALANVSAGIESDEGCVYVMFAFWFGRAGNQRTPKRNQHITFVFCSCRL